MDHFDKKRCKAANHLHRNASSGSCEVMKFCRQNSSRRLYKAKPINRSKSALNLLTRHKLIQQQLPLRSEVIEGGGVRARVQ